MESVARIMGAYVVFEATRKRENVCPMVSVDESVMLILRPFRKGILATAPLIDS